MLLTEVLTPARVRVPLAAADKRAVIEELVRFLVESAGGDYADVLAAVEDREAVLSTGIGYGVALPHGRTPSVPDLALVCGRSERPIAFEAIDGEPVRLFFLLVSPERCAGQHVKALSRIARLVRRESLRGQLLAARSAAAFYQALVDAEAR